MEYQQKHAKSNTKRRQKHHHQPRWTPYTHHLITKENEHRGQESDRMNLGEKLFLLRYQQTLLEDMVIFHKFLFYQKGGDC